MNEEDGFVMSSGNVFLDIGVEEPDEMLLKADLAHNISRIIDDNCWTQEQAAVALGVDQPKVSALVRGRLSGFSVDRLLRYVNVLGYDVTIRISPKPAARAHAYMRLVEADVDSSEASPSLEPEALKVS